jgi:hypothetical protein
MPSSTTATVVSSTRIVVRVPSGATSGVITVTTPAANASSTSSFRVSPLAAEPSREQTVGLYPNPAHQRTTLYMDAAPVPRTMALFDALGRQLQRRLVPAHATAIEVELQDLLPGVYTVHCGNSTGRLVVE